MAHFETRNRRGFHWLCAVVNKKVYWLHRQAKIGDCFRPGQRMKA
jgi:hypothetical protein